MIHQRSENCGFSNLQLRKDWNVRKYEHENLFHNEHYQYITTENTKNFTANRGREHTASQKISEFIPLHLSIPQ